jgi:hypothetical protein
LSEGGVPSWADAHLPHGSVLRSPPDRELCHGLEDHHEPDALGVGSSLLFQVEARRASGAGNVYVFTPNYLYLAGPECFSGTVPTPLDDLL